MLIVPVATIPPTNTTPKTNTALRPAFKLPPAIIFTTKKENKIAITKIVCSIENVMIFNPLCFVLFCFVLFLLTVEIIPRRKIDVYSTMVLIFKIGCFL